MVHRLAWGSGKSSAVNLVLYHLREAIEANEIVVVKFACWWFRGEEALALAFFRELYAGLGPTIGEKFKNALPKLGSPSTCWIIGRRSRRHDWGSGRGRCGFRSDGVAIWTHPTGRDS